MRIIEREISIKIVDREKFILTSFFDPFGFLPLNMTNAIITVKTDGDEQHFLWKNNERKITFILNKIGHMTNQQIFAGAKLIKGEIVISECMEVLVYAISISCSKEQLDSETPWEKEARLEEEKLREIFKDAKPVPFEELAGKSPT